MNPRKFFFDFLNNFDFGFGSSINHEIQARVEFYPNNDHIPFSVYFENDLVLRGTVRFTSSSSRTFYVSDLFYSSPEKLLLYQPDELKRWYPSVFLPFTDVKKFLSRLFSALSVWYSKNPNFLCVLIQRG